jgi:hypothetical protein
MQRISGISTNPPHGMAGATISLHEVRNFRGEQNILERMAIDRDSRVCQVSETLLFTLLVLCTRMDKCSMFNGQMNAQ